MHPKLTKPPVTYVLAQIKFSSIEDIEKYVRKLQDKIRGAFPHYQPINTQTIQLRDDQQPTATTLTQWHFLDKKKQTGIILDKQTLTIHTSHYDQFKPFINELEKVATQFHKILNFSLYTRLGLRYNNLIEGDLTNIDAGLQGFQLRNNGFDENQFLTRTETTQRSKEGVIKIQATRIPDKKIIENSQNIFVSPNLVDTAKLLSFAHYKTPKQELLMLDIDHFNNDQGDFDVKEILNHFNRLQDVIYLVFCKAIGEINLKNWSRK